MRVLVLGARGQIGRQLMHVLRLESQLEVLGSASRKLDSDPVDVIADFTLPGALNQVIRETEPEVVINAAAYTAVDRAEQESELAFQINAKAPAEAAMACRSLGARLIHYSTDYVFDGTATTPYRPDNATSPVNRYGESKRAGEVAVLDAGCDAMILRTAWVYGLHGTNFLSTMLRLAATQASVRVVDDQFGCPTPADLIARATVRALDSGLDRQPIYHLVTQGQASWADFAERIFCLAKGSGWIGKQPHVDRISTADYPTLAQRPRFSVLDSSDYQRDFTFELPGWQNALENYILSKT